MALIVEGFWLQLILCCAASISLGGEHFMYLSFPILAWLTIVLSYGVLKLAGEVHKLTSAFVESPVGLIPQRKYYSRLKGSLRMSAIEFGNFHRIESDYFSVFLVSAMNQIIGLLLSVEVSV